MSQPQLGFHSSSRVPEPRTNAGDTDTGRASTRTIRSEASGLGSNSCPSLCKMLVVKFRVFLNENVGIQLLKFSSELNEIMYVKEYVQIVAAVTSAVRKSLGPMRPVQQCPECRRNGRRPEGAQQAAPDPGSQSRWQSTACGAAPQEAHLQVLAQPLQFPAQPLPMRC